MPTLELSLDILPRGRDPGWRWLVLRIEKGPGDINHDATEITPPMEHTRQMARH